VVLYGRSTFSEVQTKYQSYHKSVHKELLKMQKDQVAQVASMDRQFQHNTAFLLAGYDHLEQLKRQQSGAGSLGEHRFCLFVCCCCFVFLFSETQVG
jgi:hypothetical protein